MFFLLLVIQSDIIQSYFVCDFRLCVIFAPMLTVSSDSAHVSDPILIELIVNTLSLICFDAVSVCARSLYFDLHLFANSRKSTITCTFWKMCGGFFSSDKTLDEVRFVFINAWTIRNALLCAIYISKKTSKWANNGNWRKSNAKQKRCSERCKECAYTYIPITRIYIYLYVLYKN